MAIPVSMALTAPVFDTLPALKAKHFSGRPAAGRLYSYARLYAGENGLSVSLTAFERQPAPESRLGLALWGAGPRLLFLTLAPPLAEQDGACLRYVGQDAFPTPAEAERAPVEQSLIPQRYASEDEQGWYWGGVVHIPPPALRAAGIRLAGGAAFRLAMYKFHAGEAAFASTAPLTVAQSAFSPAALEPCVVMAPGAE